jgi:hypothetical protein
LASFGAKGITMAGVLLLVITIVPPGGLEEILRLDDEATARLEEEILRLDEDTTELDAVSDELEVIELEAIEVATELKELVEILVEELV